MTIGINFVVNICQLYYSWVEICLTLKQSKLSPELEILANQNRGFSIKHFVVSKQSSVKNTAWSAKSIDLFAITCDGANRWTETSKIEIIKSISPFHLFVQFEDKIGDPLKIFAIYLPQFDLKVDSIFFPPPNKLTLLYNLNI